MKKTLGDIIKSFRDENNMSMDDFAKISNLSKGYISMLEKNENPSNKKPITPSLDTYNSVAKALNTDIDTLLSMIDSDEPIRLSINRNREELNIDNLIPKKKDVKDMIIIENGLPAIIDKVTWAKAQERIKNSKRLPRQSENGKYYILTGLLCCGECGAPMSGGRRKNDQGNYYYYYRCNNQKRTHKCPALSVRADKIEKEVLDCFNDVLFTPANKDAIINSMVQYMGSQNEDTNYKAEIEKEIETVDKQIENILTAIMNGITSTSVNEKLKELENKKETLKLNLEKSKLIKLKSKDLEDKIRNFLNINNNIYDFTPQEQNAILKAFIDKISYEDKKITVQLKMLDCVFSNGAGNPCPSQSTLQKTIILKIA